MIDDAYAVLGCTAEATVEDLRRAFQRQALLLHPDKAGAGSTDAFDRLQRAWKLLGDPVTRREHDLQMRAAVLAQAGHASRVQEGDLGDMTYEERGDGSGLWRYPCRCGGQYVVHEHSLGLW